MLELITSNCMLLPLATTLGIFGWSLYSARRRKSLQKGEFTKIQILSETREAYGDKSKIPKLAQRFSRRLSSLGKLSRSFTNIGGDHFDDVSKRGSIRIKGDVAFQYTKEGDQWAMYGRRKPTDLTLRELVSEKSTMIEIEEDVFKRMNWSKRIDECVPIKKTQIKKNQIEGSYSFCHRDYVNHEELMGMMWKRGGIESFLFKPSRAGELVVGKDLKCVLTERSKLFYIIPICITWEGTLKDGSIHWDTTSLMLGWENFGKLFDKPPAAERLRKDPWHISVPKNDSTGDILCFEREGKGHLVFAREACLSKGCKSQ